MKFIEKYEHGRPVLREVFWSDHYPGCKHCREVDLAKPRTFSLACVLGSQLLNDELVKRQAPIVKQKRAEVLEWAKRAGVFKV